MKGQEKIHDQMLRYQIGRNVTSGKKIIISIITVSNLFV